MGRTCVAAKKNERKISQFFKPVSPEKAPPSENIDELSKTQQNSSCSQDSSSNIPAQENEICDIECSPIRHPNSQEAVAKIPVKYDIGLYIGKSIDDFTLKNLITNPWTPPLNYDFPYSTHVKGGKERKRFASHKHLQVYEWLVFSDDKKGYFCKYCPFFVSSGLGGSQKNVVLKALVTTPLTKFAKLFGVKDGDLNTHNLNKYHKDAVKAAKDFLETYNQPALSIENQINNPRLDKIRENRERFEPIVKTIIMMGRLNIAFRGHRDDGKITADKSCIDEGNFRAILEYRAEVDQNLKRHLENSSNRATYISKTTQNEIIDCCKEEILSHITGRIQASTFYSILFDETTDLANKAQLTLVLRYVHDDNVHEHFVEFIDVRSESRDASDDNNLDDILIDEEEVKLSGKKIGQVVLKIMDQLALDVNHCVGITTDGCSTMVSEVCGAVQTIKTRAVNAVFSPCHNHTLNLSISQTSKVRMIRNAVGTMQETIFFLVASSKRAAVVNQKMNEHLIELCETRWVERHNAVLQFRLKLPTIISILESISRWKERDVAIKSQGLIKSLTQSDILVAIVCLSDLLSCTKELSTFFQKKNIDLKSARNELNLTLKLLKRRREKCDLYFKNLFEEITGLAQEISCDIRVPRVVSQQVHRENYCSTDPEDYYRQSIYIPALDSMISDLESRFSEDTMELYNFSILFPENDGWKDSESITKLVQKYEYFLNAPNDVVESELKHELERWSIKWENKIDINSCSAIELLQNCDPVIYPRISFFLRIAATLAVSNATPERTFSTLKRLETWLRTTMTQERLTGLALLHIHKKIPIDTESVIDRFAKRKNRRIDFVI